MIIPKRVPLSRQTANSLEQEILNLRWETRLPGYRTLCKELKVSRKTLVAALEILTRRKLLLPPNGTRARLINPDFVKDHHSQPSHKRRILIIITNSSFLENDEKKNSLLGEIHASFQEKNWQCRFMDTEEISYQPKARLKQLHQDHPKARWLIDMPSYETTKWCVRNNIRAIAYGGVLGRVKLPCVGASLSALLIQAHQYLHSIGHQRIVALIERPSSDAIERYANYLLNQNIVFRENYHIPKLENMTPTKFQSLLENLFSITPPTAVIISNNKQLIALLGFCIRRNIRIPEDLSIVLSNDLPHKEWFLPGISYFSRDRDREVQAITSYIEHYPIKTPKPMIIPRKFVDKGSVLPPIQKTDWSI